MIRKYKSYAPKSASSRQNGQMIPVTFGNSKRVFLKQNLSSPCVQNFKQNSTRNKRNSSPLGASLLMLNSLLNFLKLVFLMPKSS